MSAAEREEVVRSGVTAWNDNDLDALLELLEPDFEMRLAGAFLGLEPEYHGHDGVRRFWTEFRGTWKTLEVRIDRVEHFRNWVLADLHFRGIGREDLEVEMSFFILFEVPGDRIRSWRNFTDREAARAAARSLVEQKAGKAG